jgi:hypothetical protein
MFVETNLFADWRAPPLSHRSHRSPSLAWVVAGWWLPHVFVCYIHGVDDRRQPRDIAVMPDEPVDPLQLMTVFRCFDTDRSGGISLQEMQAAAKTVGGISMKDGVSER